MAKRSRAPRLGAVTPVSCVKPTYGGVMSGDIVGTLVQIAFIGAGVGAGYLAGGGLNRSSAVTLIVGGGVGLVAGVYPSLVAQRAVTRSSECAEPGLGALFAYNMGRTALAGVATSVAKAIAPTNQWLPGTLGTAVFFGAPLAGKAIIKT